MRKMKQEVKGMSESIIQPLRPGRHMTCGQEVESVNLNYELKFGKFDATWERYGLYEAEILFNNRPTGYKAIIQRGKIVTIRTTDYRLLPNELAVEMSDRAAEMAGFIPFDEFKGPWFAPLGSHVISDKNGLRIHAFYTKNEHFDVNGEPMHIGVGVHNSIDGTLGFGVGVFTFRHACANMVFAGMPRYEQTFDERKTIECVYKKHTKGIEEIIRNLKNAILTVFERANEIIEAYKRLAEEQADREFIERIKKSRLPRKILPDYIREEMVELPDLTKWQVYNDLTAAIWHNRATDLKTKEGHFRVLHQVIPLTIKRA